MNRHEPPTQPPDTEQATASARPGAPPDSSELGVLHGRLLRVSRLATIGEITAGVAHELNQPLTAVANYAQACERLLARGGPDPEALREALREITSQAVRAGEILRRLRSLAANFTVKRAWTDVNTAIAEALELTRADSRARGVRLTLELGADVPPAFIDRNQIQHAVVNLVRNAIEAFDGSDREAREVVVRSRRVDEGTLELSVSDNGPGLTPEARKRMFDPHFTTKESGTGLGLPISHTIVRAHGGELGARPSEAGGACFYVRLPCRDGG